MRKFAKEENREIISFITYFKSSQTVFFSLMNYRTLPVCDVIVTAVENGHRDSSSNPGRGHLHFTLH